MKAIQPIQIWKDGENKTVNFLNAYVVNDNLKDTATFYYGLYQNQNAIISDGNITMDGISYQGWLTNEYAYDFIANKLGLTLL